MPKHLHLSRLLVLGLTTIALFAIATPFAAADPPRPAAGTAMMFRVDGGELLQVSSFSYDRAQVAPIIGTVDALPHGSELSKLDIQVATPAEVGRRCGEETMACYDPLEEKMVIDGQDEELDGVSRASLIAHEYGHHIANNREGGIWSAFQAGTPRWSTYEEVCERTRAGELFPGNEGAHYWENPGEAFAQTYAKLVVPETPWPYTSLLEPDETALRMVREDVLDPVVPRHLRWQIGRTPRAGRGIGEAMPVEGASFARTFQVPYDGRIAIHLKADDGGRYRLLLRDAGTGELLTWEDPTSHGETHLHYADCGHRSVEVTAEAVGSADGFTAEVATP